VDALRKGQINGDESSGEFAPLVEEVVKKLKADAAVNSVLLPADFGFGFDDYLNTGLKPSTAAVARLSVQLKTTAALCNILYAAKVSNIVSITREVFDDSGAKAASTAGGGFASPGSPVRATGFLDVPSVPASELYQVERFGIEFNGRENAVWEVLNALSKGPPYVVIRDALVESMIPAFGQSGNRAVAAPATAATTASIFDQLSSGVAANPAITNVLVVPRDERVVAGRESVKASLLLDVYRFETFKGGAP
jgi:hypothetical protein